MTQPPQPLTKRQPGSGGAQDLGESSGSRACSDEEPTALELLLVDDEEDFRESAAQYFRRMGHHVASVGSACEALAVVKTRQFDVAVLDVHMPETDGVDLLPRLLDEDEHLQVLMLTGGATVSTAVASMKAGAIDYVTKPIRMSDLELLIRKAARTGALKRENERLRNVIRRQHSGPPMVGDSPAMREVTSLIDRIAGSDKPVLIEGESGTGKELVARQIHAKSSVADRPWVVINCAALPDALLESELFGHERGAFTGAVATKPGLFEMADGGTLFIDELGELAPMLQAKLLRVLEDGIIRRVGSVKERKVRVRIVAATNRDLGAAVAEGQFREDLYYRINVLRLVLPPLRERVGDLERLVVHLVGRDWVVDQEAWDTIAAYHWPGNVRQLINAVERAKLLSSDRTIRRENLPPEILAATAAKVAQGAETPLGAVGDDLESLNRRHVWEVLRRVGGNKAEAARQLGVHRRSLYRLIARYGLG